MKSVRHSKGTWLLRLFPSAWRKRYAPEFLALIEDSPPRLRDLLDIVISAADARLRPQAWAVETGRDEQMVLRMVAGPPISGRPSRTSGVRPPRSDAERRFTRRAFLRNTVLGGAGIVAMTATAGVISFAQPNTTGVFGKEVAIPHDLIPAPGAPPYKHFQGRFWLINNDDGALALYWKCTHLGCTVPWSESEGQFHCPCHQSIYNRFGERISGPAPRPLDLMAMRVESNGSVIVDTGDIKTRDAYDPSQAVKLNL